MTLLNLLAVYNPSNYWRSGIVTLPWMPIAHELGLKPDEVVLTDLSDRTGTPLLAQVNSVDPDNPERDVLVFALPHPIPPSAKDDSTTSAFIRLDRGNPPPSRVGELDLDIVEGANGQVQGVRLTNHRLIVWFSLVPDPEHCGHDWYAGAATSVQLDHREILDPFPAARGEWMGQSPEKRCMQIDRLQLPGFAHERLPYHEVDLFQQPYRLVSHTVGPVRASITIASTPFRYVAIDPATAQQHHLMGELWRVIHLDAGADYLMEELYVKAWHQEGLTPAPQEIDFAARYFTHMNLGQAAGLYQIPPLPDWFALGGATSPYPGYGFATDVRMNLAHSDRDTEAGLGRVTWQLLPCCQSRCLHLFMRDADQQFEAKTGHAWYEYIYQPIRANLYQGNRMPFNGSDDRLILA